MAVVNRNSNVIANAVASPRVISSPQDGAPEYKREVVGLVTPANDDSANSIHRFCRVPSNARVSRVGLTCAVATTAGAVDVGIYETAENGGAVVDADFFASAQALITTALNDTDVIGESGVNTLAKRVQPLWQALALAADPHKEYDIAWTITTTFNGGPTAALMKVDYVK